MSLVGRLEDLALADIFQIISLSKKTGTLVLKGKAGAAVIVFRNGQIVQAATDNLRDTLGNILISKGLITERDLARAIETQKGAGGGRRLGQILVDQGALSDYLLGETIRQQIEDMIFSLLGWEEGFFNFDLGEVAPSDTIEVVTQEFLLKAGINPEYLLMESARVLDERKRDGAPAKSSAPGTPAQAADQDFSEFFGDEGIASGGKKQLGSAASQRSCELATLKAMFEELRFPSATAEITLLVLRYASELVNRAVLFMVTRDEVRGLGQFGIELREGSPDQRVRQIRVPVSETSIFSDAIRDRRSRTGRFSDNAWDTYLVKELGGQEPGAFFLVPMVSNGRAAAVLYGDDLPDMKPLPDITGLEIFVHQAGLAMEKALLERRVVELEKQKSNN